MPATEASLKLSFPRPDAIVPTAGPQQVRGPPSSVFMISSCSINRATTFLRKMFQQNGLYEYQNTENYCIGSAEFHFY